MAGVKGDEMNILVIGSGGREHALAWKLSTSPQVERVFVAPGNAGTSLEPGVENLPIVADDTDALIHAAQTHQVDLTVVGPEAPLVDGIVDRFEEAGLACFGPRAGPAQLEGSKSFTKAIRCNDSRWNTNQQDGSSFKKSLRSDARTKICNING